jgi:thiamine kinase-like enzyme
MLSESLLQCDEEKLLQDISALAYFSDKTLIDITAISSGLSQPSFCVVSTTQQRYFVKRLSAYSKDVTHDVHALDIEDSNNSNHCKLDKNQLNAAVFAAQQGLTATVLYYDGHWLVSAFVAGETLDGTQLATTLSTEDKIDITLELLVSCHQLPRQSIDNVTATIPTFSPHRVIESLMSTIRFSQKQQHAAQTLTRQLLAPLATNREVITQVFCHGDANFSNVIYAKDSDKQSVTHIEAQSHPAMLIDFDCACLAPAEYDVGMFIAINELSADGTSAKQVQLSEQIAKKYNQLSANSTGNTADLSLLLVTRYHAFSLFINALWYLSMYQLKGAEIYNTKAGIQLMLLRDCLHIDTYLIDEMR